MRTKEELRKEFYKKFVIDGKPLQNGEIEVNYKWEDKDHRTPNIIWQWIEQVIEERDKEKTAMQRLEKLERKIDKLLLTR